jgi:hypothetical protein
VAGWPPVKIWFRWRQVTRPASEINFGEKKEIGSATLAGRQFHPYIVAAACDKNFWSKKSYTKIIQMHVRNSKSSQNPKSTVHIPDKETQNPQSQITFHKSHG